MNALRVLSLSLLLFSSVSITSATAADQRGPIFVAPLHSNVSDAQFIFLRRALKTAERQHASAFVIDMKTYGGDVKSAIDIMDALLKTKVPTFTFVNDKAISAGALIAMATQKIYMAPTSVIGAAAPVLSSGDDLPKTMSDKTVSTLSAMARAASQQNGHNPDIADAFINKEKEVKIGDVTIDKSDSLLTLSAQEAARVFDGKPLLAQGIAGSVEEVISAADLSGAEIRRIEPTGFERLAFWITAIAPLLLLGGIVGGYIEFKIPGFGIAGIISIVCFTLFFVGHYIAGLAGWETAVCFALGVALVIGELIVHPGTILPGLAGIILILVGLTYAMVDHWPSQPVWPTQEMLFRPLMNLALAIGAAILIGYLLAEYLPRTSLYRRLVLAAAVPAGPALEISPAALIVSSGARGQTKTMLRPSGKAVFGEQLVDVVSRGEFIEAGAPVRVISIEGAKVVVEAA
jgi:membrane-bound serine protease (ClpP class)